MEKEETFGIILKSFYGRRTISTTSWLVPRRSERVSVAIPMLLVKPKERKKERARGREERVETLELV